MKPPEGAVRKRKVPDELRAKNVRERDVLEWARGELNGVEPDLGTDLIRKIKSGEVTEVVLRPKRPGFFLPDGTFVEAFEYQPSFGEDLDEAEKQWEGEEADNAWVDEENRLFNKRTVENQPRIGEALWEHGRRIVNHANENQRSVSRILHLLDRRKGPDGYARHTHQTCVDFYRWIPELQTSDSILDWKWERIDSVLRFSNDDHVRNHLKSLLETTDLGRVRDDLLARLLGIKTRQSDHDLQSDDVRTLNEVRTVIRATGIPGPSLVANAIAVVERTRSAGVNDKPEGPNPD